MQVWLWSGVAVFAAVAAQAQDVSEVQRCVWSCLAGPGGGNASSPAYDACVEERCVPLLSEAEAAPDEVWEVRPTGWGGSLATIQSADGVRSLSWICEPDGPSYLILDDTLEGPGGLMAIEVDGQRYDVSFARDPDWLQSNIAPDSEILSALAGGQTARLLGVEGQVLATFSLRGSGAAITQVRASCS